MSKYRSAPSPTSSEDEEMVAALFPERPQELFPTENVQQPLTPSFGIGMSSMDIKDKPDDQSKAISSNVAEFLLDLAYEDHKNGGTEYKDLIKLKEDILREIVEYEGTLHAAGSQGLPKLYFQLVDDILPYGTPDKQANDKAMAKLDYLVSQLSRYKPQISTNDKSLAADELKMKNQRIDTLISLITDTMDELDGSNSSSKSKSVSYHVKKDMEELGKGTLKKISAINPRSTNSPKTLKRESPHHFAPSSTPMKKSKSESELSRPLSFVEHKVESDLSGLSEFEGEESDNEEQEREGAKSAPPDISPKKKGGLRSRKRKGKKHKTTKKRVKKRTMKRRKRTKRKTRKPLR